MTNEEMFAILLNYVIDELYSSDSCCVACCWPCSVVHHLLIVDKLDISVSPSLVNEEEGNTSWWRFGKVDREMLQEKWFGESCPNAELHSNSEVVEKSSA